MKEFNVMGTCVPDIHYMVNIADKLKKIKALVDAKKYFTINCGRQYGKTTTLLALEYFLSNDYTVISLNFEGFGEKLFSTERNFCREFLKLLRDALELSGHGADEQAKWEDETVDDFASLSRLIRQTCRNSSSNYVLMIDEVNKIRNNTIFLNFLRKLREKYLARNSGKDFTFHSVILASVYDIAYHDVEFIIEKELPTPITDKIDFKIEMEFNAHEITTMLVEYEKDYATGMDVDSVAKELYTFTSGYPFMVSRLCQIIHEDDKGWNVYGVRKAVTEFLKEDHSLFRDIAQNLESRKELYHLLYDVVILGLRRSFSYDNPIIGMAHRYGYIKFDQQYSIVVFNKIFETRISNYFITKNEQSKLHQRTNTAYYKIGTNDHFDMESCLKNFAEFWDKEIFPTIEDEELLEIKYRISFLAYLKPLLDGVGHYHYEGQLNDEHRMGLIVNYGYHEYVIKLKRIFSEDDRTEGLAGLLCYMNERGTDVGYYLTFGLEKGSKLAKGKWNSIVGKKIFEIGIVLTANSAEKEVEKEQTIIRKVFFLLRKLRKMKFLNGKAN